MISRHFIPGSLLLSALLLAGGSFALFSSADGATLTTAEAATEEATPAEPAKEEHVLPEDYGQKLSMEDLNARITRSTVTPCSQAYDVTFFSTISAETYFGLNNGRNTYIWVTDLSFSDDIEPVEEGEEDQMPHFTGEVLYFDGIKEKNPDIVIPAQLQCGRRFFIDVVSIFSEPFARDNDGSSAKNLRSLVIPASIKRIDSNTFAALKMREDKGAGVTFKILAAKDDPTLEYDESVFPEGSTIKWNYKPESAETRVLERSKSAGKQDFTNERNYVIGYDALPDDMPCYQDLRLKILYYFVGSDELHSVDLPIQAKESHFDAIGDMAGRDHLSLPVTLPLKDGEVIDDKRIYFANIFPLDILRRKPKLVYDASDVIEGATDNPVPGTSTKCYLHAQLMTAKKDTLAEFIDLKYDGITSFAGHTSIRSFVDAKVNMENFDIYKAYKQSVFTQEVEDKFNSGMLWFRPRFTLLNSIRLRITYAGDDGTVKECLFPVVSRYDYYNMPGNKHIALNFLLDDKEIAPDFSARRLRTLTVENLHVEYDLFYTTGENKIVTRSAFSTRFAILPIVTEENRGGVHSVDMALGLVTLFYSLIYAGCSTGTFFYMKNKYRNDEFRRVRPKSFLKNAIIGYVSMGIIILATMFVGYRFGRMDNSIVVANLLDPFIVVFAVASIFVIGYYVKYFTALFKARKERLKVIRLKLDEEVDESGT